MKNAVSQNKYFDIFKGVKKPVLVILVFVCSLFCSGCAGYNVVMRQHLSSSDNYDIYQVRLIDIYYDDKGEKNRDFTNEDFENHDVTFLVAFDNYDDVSAFLGAMPNQDIPLSEYTCSLEVVQENNAILVNHGFYKDISLNEIIEIKAANFIYMDGEYFHIAGVKYHDVTYLDFDEGLSNIVHMMHNNKSLF